MRHNQAAQVHIAELLIELGKKENLDANIANMEAMSQPLTQKMCHEPF